MGEYKISRIMQRTSKLISM